MEHFVLHVTMDKRTHMQLKFYCGMCGLMKCLNKAQFNPKDVEFKNKWAIKKLV